MREGRISEVIWLQHLVILVEGPDIHVESIEKRRDGFAISIHGHGESELLTRFISHRRGSTWSIGGVGTASGKRGAWDVVHVDLDGCSVRSVTLSTETA